MSGSSYYKRGGRAIGNAPRRNGNNVSLDAIDGRNARRGYASGNASPRSSSLARHGSLSSRNGATRDSELDLLAADDEDSDSGSDLPPPAKRSSPRRSPHTSSDSDVSDPYPTSGTQDPGHHALPQITASGALNAIMNSTAAESAAWFKRVDEDFIKPKLLLDGGSGGRGPSGGGGGSGNV